MVMILNNLILAIALSSQLAPAAPAQPERVVVMPEMPSSSHAYLGVGLRDVSDDRVADLKLKDAHGVEVVAVDHDGPAAAFIHVHDVILAINGQQVSSGEQIRSILHGMQPHQKVDLEISRNGDAVKAEISLGDR